MAERKDDESRKAVEPKAKSEDRVPRPSGKPRRRTIRAGGHVTTADESPETPERKPMCSVHGHNCPGGHDKNRGWTVEKKG